MAKAFEAAGWEVFTVDWNKKFKPTFCADIGELSAGDLIELCGGVPDVIWASPDCTTYSIAGIRFHRRKNPTTEALEPVSEYASFCDEVNAHVMELIREINPTYYFVENPRGCFRKMDFIKDYPRYTVTYCQYGDTRMKPTDIFTNHPNPQFKPPCKNGAPCHQPAPRGSQNGTQALKTKEERAMIPEELCSHIVEICSDGADKTQP